MKVWLATQLRRLAAWLDPAPDLGPLVAAARVLVAAVEDTHGAGFGEAKRHQVYARLLKDWPAMTKRQVSRAIEDALETMTDE